jgi:hypothetical protein
MLGAVSVRLAQEKVRRQFAPAGHRLAERDHDGVWSICCPALTPAVDRLVHLVLTTPSTKEAT